MVLTATIFEVQKSFARQAYNYFEEMVNQGAMTAAVLSGLTTYVGYRAIAYATFETGRRFYEQFQKRSDNAFACGILTDAIIAADNGSLNSAGSLDSDIDVRILSDRLGCWDANRAQAEVLPLAA